MAASLISAINDEKYCFIGAMRSADDDTYAFMLPQAYISLRGIARLLYLALYDAQTLLHFDLFSELEPIAA